MSLELGEKPFISSPQSIGVFERGNIVDIVVHILVILEGHVVSALIDEKWDASVAAEPGEVLRVHLLGAIDVHFEVPLVSR